MLENISTVGDVSTVTDFLITVYIVKQIECEKCENNNKKKTIDTNRLRFTSRTSERY